MKKRKQSNNDQLDTTPSHHNSDNPQSANGVAAKNRNLDWIGISNIIISLLVGVGLAIYFNIRNEQLQINIAKGNYSSASLLITCPQMDCTQMIKITNTGFGEAKNVNIVIAIGSVPLPWTPFVNTIDQFRLSVHPLSAEVRKSSIMDSSVNSLPSKKNNAYKLALDSLGGQASITVNIYPDVLYKSIKGMTEYKQQYSATLYYTTSESHALTTPNSIEEIVNDFIDSNFFAIANLTIDASCSTCSGDTSYASYPSFKASTNSNTFLVSSNSETFMPTGVPQVVQNGVYDLALSYTVDYMMPRVSNQISIPSPLYLQVNHYGSDNQSIQECQAANCSIFSSG